MKNIDYIIHDVINESIDNRMIISEGELDDIKSLLDDFVKKTSKTKSDYKKLHQLKKKMAKKKKGKKKARKRAGGGKTYYDYGDYEKSHKKTNKGDAESIRRTIDMDNTDIAAVAPDVFKNHTRAGAQSHLRKVLTGERPMTDDVASTLQGMISNGEVAVK